MSAKSAEKEWSLLDIVAWGSEYFYEKGIESPRLNIELLLCHALNLSRVEIYTQFDKPLTKEELTQIRELVIKRAKRVPLQYIIGYTQFYGLKFDLNESILIPRPETEQLVDLVLKQRKSKSHVTILDIGTGSGCIAITLAKELPESKVFGIDISHDAINIAKSNAESNDVQNIEFLIFDILKKIPRKHRFDLIVSNPPYIPENEYRELEPEVHKEPKIALVAGEDGLLFYRRFAGILPYIMNPGGEFFFEIGENQKEALEKVFNKFEFVTIFAKDWSDKERYMQGEFRKLS